MIYHNKIDLFTNIFKLATTTKKPKCSKSLLIMLLHVICSILNKIYPKFCFAMACFIPCMLLRDTGK